MDALVHWTFRIALAAYLGALALARRLVRSRRSVAAEGLDILLTGTFQSDSWLAAHVVPLARSRRCRRLRMVSTSPVPVLDASGTVEAIYPPTWLIRAIGRVPARLLTFLAVAVRSRPDVLGGFHLLVNGLAAGLGARLTGCRALYFCVGGPVEVIDGGIWTESRLFEKLRGPDAVVERQLLHAVDDLDVIITMGTRAASFFRDRGIEAPIHVVSGGIERTRFRAVGATTSRPIDMILVGRLVPIKRIELFLDVVKELALRLPRVSATVVGDGPLRDALEARARELGVASQVCFAGQQVRVEQWLSRAKVFVLTSESEGLSLALMEAMTAGLPAVVTSVGDLGDLVEDGTNGYLVPEPTASAFADRLCELLGNPDRLAAFSAAAARSAGRYEVDVATRRWDEILSTLMEPASAR